jgi:hypothetical protein
LLVFSNTFCYIGPITRPGEIVTTCSPLFFACSKAISSASVLARVPVLRQQVNVLELVSDDL